jgi:hypothetical protein
MSGFGRTAAEELTSRFGSFGQSAGSSAAANMTHYSITSSALSKMDVGSVRPSALAVLD